MRTLFDRSRNPKLQFVFLSLLTLITFVIFYEADFAERFFQFSREHETWELDDLMFSIGSALLLNALILATLRWFEAQQQAIVANTDPLTGILNRRGFEQQLKKSIELAQRNHQSLALLMLDLDNFKQTNDLYGHFVGDATLVLVATTLKSQLLETAYLARWGGDEFVILAERRSLAEAQKIGEDIQHLIGESTWGNTSQLGISFGVAELTALDTSMTLLQRADQSLYISKRKKQNKHYRTDCHRFEVCSITSRR